MDSDESEGKDWSDLEAEAQRGTLICLDNCLLG